MLFYKIQKEGMEQLGFFIDIFWKKILKNGITWLLYIEIKTKKKTHTIPFIINHKYI